MLKELFSRILLMVILSAAGTSVVAGEKNFEHKHPFVWDYEETRLIQFNFPVGLAKYNFDTYRTGPVHKKKAAAIKWKSHPRAWSHRTKLKEAQAASTRASFASKFNTVIFGCGGGCMTGLLINRETGEVTDFPTMISFFGKMDWAWQPDSSLLVIAGYVGEDDVSYGINWERLREEARPPEDADGNASFIPLTFLKFNGKAFELVGRVRLDVLGRGTR
jgi:hypothetical protein